MLLILHQIRRFGDYETKVFLQTFRPLRRNYSSSIRNGSSCGAYQAKS